MKTILQLFAILVSILFITGCVSIIPLKNIDDQAIGRELSEQQVKEAIHRGVEAAGWTIDKEGPGKILATYTVRTHDVAVNIRYTEKNYSINYAYSNNMKVHCTDQEKAKGVVITSWPKESCGGARPQLIHAAYEEWVEELKLEIDAALSST
jgi:hypothetical protein